MLTEKDYCDYETAFGLCALGYPCTAWTLLYTAQKWLREEKGIHIEITYSPACWTCKIYDLKERDYIKGFTFIDSYEEALSEGIKEAVKILKNNGKAN